MASLAVSLAWLATGCGRCRPAVEGALWDFDPAKRKTGHGWHTTGFLERARGLHTATLLKDGTVLVAGGDSCHELLRSCERYDPVAATWTEAPPLNVAREHHTALRLQDGRVLVIGGTHDTTRAEIYDPAAAAWRPTGPMAVPRGKAPAVVLKSGKVLVAGGMVGEHFHQASGRVEIYDPRSDTWREAPGLSKAKAGRTLTLLADGRAWLAGGCDPDSGRVDSAAEIYDPKTDQWSASTPLREARCEHSATLLPDGRVLVAGGVQGSSENSGDQALASAEIFNPASSEPNEEAAPMESPRDLHHAALLPNGHVLVQGGPHAIMDYGIDHEGVEAFDPKSNEWSSESMEAVRGENTLTVLADGSVLIAGGSSNAGPSGCCIYMDEAEIRLPLGPLELPW